MELELCDMEFSGLKGNNSFHNYIKPIIYSIKMVNKLDGRIFEGFSAWTLPSVGDDRDCGSE